MSVPTSSCPKCGFQFSSENFCPKCGVANPVASVQENDTTVVPSAVKQTRQMNVKGIIIGAAVAGAIMAIIVASYSVNTYALSNLQFRSAGGEDFDFSTLSANVRIEACNPTSFTASFDKYHIVILYKEKEFATMDIDGGTISPMQSSVLNGKVAVDRGVMADLLMQALAGGLSTSQSPEFSQDDMSVNITMEAKVLGLIPYSESKTSTMEEFQEITSNSEFFQC